ncbi:unnamed protein product, partial [marine sediment metagenome]
MNFSLPFKLGVAVVALFTVVIAACLLWKPLQVKWYAAKLKSKNSGERMK